MLAVDALKRTREMEPQTNVDLCQGVKLRRTKNGIPVLRIHYTADPKKCDPAWIEAERRKYTSQAAWRREMEIEDEAGGGELVVADALVTYWKKIVITDPAWKPNPNWRVEAGFDHGKVSPTAMVRGYVDNDGVIYLCGEYYQPGREVWQHAPVLKEMADIRKIGVCYADPSIFPEVMQQSQAPGKAAERAKSINELYIEQGIELFSSFYGDRSDVSWAGRLHAHWADLANREPTLKIVCRNFSERPQPGLHNWDCPNLLWELMRWRRAKLSALQLLKRNPSEAIVDKDNHSIDSAKYLCMSHPEPTSKPASQKAAEAVAGLVQQRDLTSALIRVNDILDEEEYSARPVRMGRRR